jgi:hypothetical protein
MPDRFILNPHIAKVTTGGMGERLKPAVLKTAVRGTVPGVRIPLPPLESNTYKVNVS